MKKTLYIALLAITVIFSGCNLLPEPEMRIDPETRKPTNRPRGITLDEGDELDASNASHQDLVNGSTSTGPQEQYIDSDIDNGAEVDESLVNPPLIDDKGRMLGHFVNMSNKSVGLKIYRVKNKLLTKKYKPIYKKEVGKMRDFCYYLSKGSYSATLAVNGVCHSWDFEVTKGVRSDCDVTIYNAKDREEIATTLDGYWYLTYNEENRLVVNK